MRIRQLLHSLDVKVSGRRFLLASLTGVVAGLGAIAFQFLCQLVLHYALGVPTGFFPEEPAGEAHWFAEGSGDLLLWGVVLVMMAGGLVSGWLVETFAPDAAGHGTDAAIEAYHHGRGYIPPRTPIIKLIASAVTIGTGGSGGREGPIAQIGAGFGSFVATRMRLSARDRRILLAAGMGAGVGAIFRAPVAGALFAAEILYRDAEFDSDVIVPTAVASIISYSVYSLSLPESLRFVPLFGAGLEFRPGPMLELIPLGMLAVVLSVAAILYIHVFYGVHRLFERMPGPRLLRPVVGAGLAGLVGVVLYHAAGGDARALAVLSAGYGVVQEALDTAAAPGMLLLLAIAAGKILTTSCTIGSGGSGGVFGPSMVIGGCIGGAVGHALHGIWPEVVAQPQAYVIVGMTGFFAGCAHAPISTLIMVSEMTGDYQLLLPAMWVSTICFLLCRPWTIYVKQVSSRLESPAHRGDFIVDILEGFRVRDVFVSRDARPLRTVRQSETLERILHLLAETEQNYFPVVDSDERLVGMFSAKDIRAHIYDEPIWHLAIARDVMITDVLTLELDDDLNTALRRFTQRNIDELPVMDPERPGRILGMLRRKESIAFYNRQLAEMKRQGE